MENKESVPQEGEFKMKKRPKKLSNDKVKANKIDLSKTLESKKEEPIKIDLDKDDTKPIKEVVEPVKEIVEEKEEIVNQKEVKSPIVEVTEDEPIEEKKEEIKKPV